MAVTNQLHIRAPFFHRQPLFGFLQSRVKIRNMGSSASPLSLGPTNAAARFLVGAAGAGSQNLEFKRIYTANTRTSIDTGIDNSYNNVIWENCWFDAADTYSVASLNTVMKGIRATNVTTLVAAVYGSHFQDSFDSTTTGKIVIAAHEKTSVEPSASSYTIDTVGIGTGEQDRVGVAEIAVFKAYKKRADDIAFRRHGCLFFEAELKVRAGSLPAAALTVIQDEVKAERGGITGGVAISDAFFPKRDGVDVLVAEGVRAIVQPGGSLGDREIIDVCNEAGVSMVFTMDSLIWENEVGWNW